MEPDYDTHTDGDAELPEVQPPRVRPYDPIAKRDRVRGHLAYVFVGLVATLTILPLVLISLGWVEWPEVADFMTLVYGTTVGLVGTVVGFYFGTVTVKERDD